MLKYRNGQRVVGRRRRYFWSLSGEKTLHGGAGDDVYLFIPDWGTDWIVESPSGGFDTMDFSGISGRMDVSVANINVTENDNVATHVAQEIESLITGTGSDAVEIKAYNNELRIQTLGGSDAVRIGESNSLDNVTGAIDLDGGAGFDRLNVFDGDDTDANLYTFNLGSFLRSGASPISYVNFETFDARVNNDVVTGTIGDGAGGLFWALVEVHGTN